MSQKQFRICASDTPSALASEVTELLSQGWELYGHPFVGAQNGHPGSGPPICQAMVTENGHRLINPAAPVTNAEASATEKLAPAPRPLQVAAGAPKATAPKRTPIGIARPPRPGIVATTRNVAVFLAVIFCGSFLADALVFRSGFYNRFLDPLSSTGTFERIFHAEADRPPTGKKEVLVMGNSRIAEGFSARLANEYKQDGYWFSNCAVPAAAARTIYYFVRDVDPNRNRYAAIAVPVDDYNDIDPTEDPADQVSNMWLVINRLRVTDILPYTLSFKSWVWRSDVIRGTTLKGLVFQRDVQEFIEHSDNRLQAVGRYRQYGSSWLYAYGGNNRSLAGMSVDWNNHRVTFPPGMPQDQQNDLSRQIFLAPRQNGWVREFQTKWLGALADLYRGSNTRVIIYQLPRNAAPRPTPLVHWPSTSVNELRKRSWVRVVDHSVFEPLERPELFFDFIHLNSDGRKLFSPLLADTVKASLP